MRDLLGPGEAVEVLRGFLNKALEESGLGSLITRKKLWRVLEYSASISTIIALKALIQGEQRGEGRSGKCATVNITDELACLAGAQLAAGIGKVFRLDPSSSEYRRLVSRACGLLKAKVAGSKATLPVIAPGFLIQLTGHYAKELGLEVELQRLYGDYSGFVHSSLTLLQLYPFTSVLEYKLLKHKLQRALYILEWLAEAVTTGLIYRKLRMNRYLSMTRQHIVA